MGRVRSKRKLKQCDPFFKGTRTNGKKEKIYDLPPNESKSKRAKKRQRKAISEKAIEHFVLHGPNASNKINKSMKKTQEKSEITTIQQGESMKDFNKRINMQVRRVIYDVNKQNRRATIKRKEYIQKKKEKEKIKKMSDQERYELEYQHTGTKQKDYFEHQDQIQFGERVNAPPILPKLSGIFKKRQEMKK